MVAPGRFELPTSGLGNRCSIQLSYGAMRRNPIMPRQLGVGEALFESRFSVLSVTQTKLNPLAFKSSP